MKAWDGFLALMEQKLGIQVVHKWMHPLKIIKFDAGNLYLQAENTFQVNWFEQYARPHTHLLINNNNRKIKIHLTAKELSYKKKSRKTALPPVEFNPSPLDTSQTLFSFISNEFVVNFLQNLTPGHYNPIFLCGPAGNGKTHLLNATVLHLQNKGLKVFFVHALTFTEHVVAAIRNSQMREFRDIYRQHDVLIIDDVHHLARKNATQEELFHTFNELHSSERQIILSSHLPPQRLTDIEPRLISRFEWGILLNLEPPSKKDLAEILNQRARVLNFRLQVSDFILKHFSSSAKNAMRALEALCLRTNTCSSNEQAEKLLSDLIEEESKHVLTTEKILESVSNYFEIRSTDITGKSQSKEFSGPRQVAMFLCRYLLKMPYKRIGAAFNRDHSTVMTSIQQITKKQKEGGETALALVTIKSQLEQD